jgi:hypothetical protein
MLLNTYCYQQYYLIIQKHKNNNIIYIKVNLFWIATDKLIYVCTSTLNLTKYIDIYCIKTEINSFLIHLINRIRKVIFFLRAFYSNIIRLCDGFHCRTKYIYSSFYVVLFFIFFFSLLLCFSSCSFWSMTVIQFVWNVKIDFKSNNNKC